MSVSMNLFFSAPGDLGEVAAALEPVLGVQLRPVHDDGELTQYEFWGLGVVLFCFTAEDFVDDRDMPFSRYGFFLSVEPRRLAGVEEEYWNNLMYYEGYPKLSLKKRSPIAARNDDLKVFNGRR